MEKARETGRQLRYHGNLSAHKWFFYKGGCHQLLSVATGVRNFWGEVGLCVEINIRKCFLKYEEMTQTGYTQSCKKYCVLRTG